MERIRRLARNILGYDSLPYSTASKIANFLSIVSKEGIGTWRKIRNIEEARGFSSKDEVVALNLNRLEFPIYLRPGTRDVETVISTIIREEYNHFKPVTDPLWMIDAGAYIGDTAAFFLSRYPGLRVIALEPGTDSFALAEKNLSLYGDRVSLLKKGLWGIDGELYFSGESTGASAGTSGGDKIDVVSINALMRDYSIARIDILKMDIEGGEESVFKFAPEQWLSKVGLLIMEIHGPELESLIAAVLKRNGFNMVQYRSVWYCWPNG